jgi:hypothetical protein
MVRATLHVLDAVTLELRFELRKASPRRVLAALIGQYLLRCSVLGDAARQRLQHQHAPLVMRHHQAHQVPRVIVQERSHIDALMPSQQEREQIRLPQLVRLGPLEVLYRLLAPYASRRGGVGLHPFFSQHSSHRRLGGPKTQEPAHHITDASASRPRLGLMSRKDRARSSLRASALARLCPRRGGLCAERGRAPLAIRLHPLRRGRVGNLQLARHRMRTLTSLHHRRDQRLPQLL